MNYLLDPAFTLAFVQPQPPEPYLLSRVNEIWENENRSRSKPLTDGPIFSLKDYSRDRLTIEPTTYRYVIARRRAPELIQAGLTVKPVAVTGILQSADGLVLGRRGSAVAADSGLWEPMPAGGLSQPDPVAQLFKELEEEVGLTKGDISECSACGLVEDSESGTFDIVYLIRTSLTGHDVRKRFEQLLDQEHAEMAIVPVETLPAFLEENSDALLRVLRPMLGLAGMLS